MRFVKRLLAILFCLAIFALAGYFIILPVLWKGAALPNLDTLQGDANRGAYILRISGCVTCHTNHKEQGAFLAGGAEIKSPFGSFFAPNITPDLETGIGGWTIEEFANALINGVSPNGTHYYPSFPYTSYHHMKPQDMVDLMSYLVTVTPVKAERETHRLSWPFSDRSFLSIWKFLFFKPKQIYTQDKNDLQQDKVDLQQDKINLQEDKNNIVERGKYLLQMGHCAECHSPRNFLGAMGAPYLGGQVITIPRKTKIPSIRYEENALADWRAEDIALALQTGITPEGDVLGGHMGYVISDSTSQLTDKDLSAMIAYLMSLRPSSKPN